jgi:hypothetical protein
MSLISRDWICLNGKCRTAFHSYEKSNPPCPQCGCVRVDWLPNGCHIGNVAPRADKSLRAIADQHGMTNMNSVSPSRINRAAPILNAPPIPDNPEFGHRAYGATGMTAPLSRTRDPLGDIYCATAPTSVKGSVAIGSIGTGRDGGTYNTAPPRGEGNYPASLNTTIVKRHRP